MLNILGRASSINVRKVLWTCDEAGLPYRLESWGAGVRATDDPAFLARNPNAMVPVIEDDGFVLWESNTICRYLVTRHAPGPLLPADAASRARVEQWMDWQATELNNAWRHAFMARVRANPAHGDPAAIDASIAAWHRHMAILDAQLQRTGAYVAGADFTLADIVLGLSAHRWYRTPMERPVLAAVDAWHGRLATRPAFARHAPPDVP